MKIYRTQTVLTLSTWDDKKKAFIEITPAFEGASKGQPKPGEKRYDYENTVRISFQIVDMLTASYKLISMAHGDTDTTLEKFGDMAKVANSASNDKKKLSIKCSDKGVGVNFYLTEGAKKASITLNPEEVYAIGMWFQFQAQRFVNIVAEEQSRIGAPPKDED